MGTVLHVVHGEWVNTKEPKLRAVPRDLSPPLGVGAEEGSRGLTREISYLSNFNFWCKARQNRKKLQKFGVWEFWDTSYDGC